jgi:predicted dehydrogenase
MARVTRRSFLHTTAGAAVLGLPAGLYRSAVLAQEKPADRVRVGFIGVGLQGTSNLKAVLKNAVALCDVDSGHLNKAAGLLAKTDTKPQLFADYRKLLDAKDVDAVLITTPDHWHALQTVHACRAGKDVYCEKPLSLTVAEGRAMVTAARDHKRVVQTGSQQRSAREFRQACELVRNGAIGAVKLVKVGLPGPNWIDRAQGKKPVPDSAPPEGLDFDFWTGPAPKVPFNANRVHYLFRFFWDYSGGQQTNFGAHHLDIAQWGLGTDDTGPVAVEGKATFHKDKWFETPETATINYAYANGVVVNCTLGRGNPGGTTFEGEKGVVYVNRGKLEVTLNGEKVPDPYKLPTGETKLYASGNHHQNWVECVKSRKAPVCDVEIGHRSATVCHLGNIAVRLGRKIAWDPKTETTPDDKDAAAMLTKEYRSPWKL